MEYTTLGRTGLRVSVAGFGTGGFSRLGLATGGSEDQAVSLIHQAIDLGARKRAIGPKGGELDHGLLLKLQMLEHVKVIREELEVLPGPILGERAEVSQGQEVPQGDLTVVVERRNGGAQLIHRLVARASQG